MAAALAAAGVDLILVETMNTVREAAAAARGAAATGLPVVVSCVTDGGGRLLSGEPVEDFARALLSLPVPPDALGINCVAARSLSGDLARLARAAPGVPLAAYGNAYGDPVLPATTTRELAEGVGRARGAPRRRLLRDDRRPHARRRARAQGKYPRIVFALSFGSLSFTSIARNWFSPFCEFVRYLRKYCERSSVSIVR